MPLKPLKRHIALQPLSRQHHFGLLLCWKIRMGFRYEVEPKRIWAYANWFYNNHLIPHFQVEEKHIFTVLSHSHPLVIQALEEHKLLISLFEATDKTKTVLKTIETKVEQHIRFEERVLFPEIQKVATQAQMHHIKAVHQPETFVDNTTDVFWVK